MIPHPLKRPEILMTPLLAAAAERAEQDVTVVPLPLPPPVVPEAYPTRPLTAAEPQVFVGEDPAAVEVFEVALVTDVAAFEVLVAVVDAAAPVKAQVHSLEMALGLLEQLEAQAGRPVVAVTVDLVNVAQNADAVALLAEM
jgi:hypothetical protein